MRKSRVKFSGTEITDYSLGASVAAAEVEQPPALCLTVTIEKEAGEPLGAGLFVSHECRSRTVLAVSSVGNGALSAHNAAHPDNAVEVNDVITSVNGVSLEPDAMLRELMEAKVAIEVERPSRAEALGWAWSTRTRPRSPLLSPALCPQWTIEITKEISERFGADLFASPDCRGGTVLIVAGIEEGPVKRHNENHPSFSLQVNDLIISVNNIERSPREMLSEMMRGSLSIVAERPSDE
jgi:hypothetical protein